MKGKGLVLTLVTAFSVAMVCMTSSTDAYGASDGGFPSISEILSTIKLPDYGLDTFIEDAGVVLSMEMWNQIVTYLGELKNFIVEDTFLGDLTNITREHFTGDTGYINIFMLMCTGIALISVTGAVISYIANLKTFSLVRKKRS